MRFAATAFLWVITTVALAVAVPTLWVQKNVVDVEGYAAMAQRAAADPALQAAVASELTTQATALIGSRGYRVDPAKVRNVAGVYTAGPAFPAQFAQVNRVAQRFLFTADPNGHEPLVIDLAPMMNDNELQQVLQDFNVRVPATLTVPVTVSAPKRLRAGQLRALATWNPWASTAAAVLAGIAAVLTVVVARRRGRALTSLGVSALLVGAGGWAAIEVTQRHINDALGNTTGDIRQIADAMAGHVEEDVHHWLDLTLTAGGVLVAFGVVIAVLGGLRKS